MNTSGNNTIPPLYEEDILKDLFPEWHEWVYIAVYLLILLCGVIGNSLVCYFILRYAHMRTVTNTFIFNLAVADLLVLIISLVPTIIQDVFESWLLGDSLCPVSAYTQRVSFLVSILTLCAISVERYYVVCKPITLRTIPRKRWIFGVLLFIWVVSLLLCIPEILRSFVSYHLANTRYYSICSADHSPAFYYGYTVAFFILPCCIMSVAYFYIVRDLWWSGTRTIALSPTGNDSSRTLPQLRQRRNTAKMFIAVVACFIVCHMVHHVILFVKLQMGAAWLYQDPDLVGNMIIIGHILVYMNSAINPVIYSFMGEKYGELLRNSVRCRRNIDGSSVGSSTKSSLLQQQSVDPQLTLTEVNDIEQTYTSTVPDEIVTPDTE